MELVTIKRLEDGQIEGSSINQSHVGHVELPVDPGLVEPSWFMRISVRSLLRPGPIITRFETCPRIKERLISKTQIALWASRLSLHWLNIENEETASAMKLLVV